MISRRGGGTGFRRIGCRRAALSASRAAQRAGGRRGGGERPWRTARTGDSRRAERRRGPADRLSAAGRRRVASAPRRARRGRRCRRGTIRLVVPAPVAVLFDPSSGRSSGARIEGMGTRIALVPLVASISLLVLAPAAAFADGQVTLSPAAGAPGTSVVLRGSGFPASRSVVVGMSPGTARSVTSSRNGSFQARMTVPRGRSGRLVVASRARAHARGQHVLRPCGRCERRDRVRVEPRWSRPRDAREPCSGRKPAVDRGRLRRGRATHTARLRRRAPGDDAARRTLLGGLDGARRAAAALGERGADRRRQQASLELHDRRARGVAAAPGRRGCPPCRDSRARPRRRPQSRRPRLDRRLRIRRPRRSVGRPRRARR